ncbi:MAG: amidohydrolase family protein [Burkholderiales bacterium]|nr:amidohydrolase family protein [Burkholderiales bacterium]
MRHIDWLITVDGERRILRDAALAVKGGIFAAIGKSADIERGWSAEAYVDASDCVVTPGLIDNHLHSGWFEPYEIALLARRKPTLVCCPSSSLHNGYGNLAIGMHPELAALGVTVSLGTDHASSGTVDLVQEMRNCACGYKEIRMNPRLMPPEQALEMATTNGARGAGLADSIGAIEVGKAADFVLFDATAPEWQSLYNPVSNLVYSATGNTVRDVFVGGTQVVRNKRMLLVDEAALLREVRAAAARIAGRLDMKKMSKLRWPAH